MTYTIKIKKGIKENLPVLAESELGFCTDTKEIYIGTMEGNRLINEESAIITKSDKNGNILLDGVELSVYDDTILKKASHLHDNLRSLNRISVDDEGNLLIDNSIVAFSSLPTETVIDGGRFSIIEESDEFDGGSF